MNVSAASEIRTSRDALVAAGLLGTLGVLWLVLKLFWQGALLLVAAGLVAWFARRGARATAPPAKSDQADSKTKRVAAETPSRQKKRRRKR